MKIDPAARAAIHELRATGLTMQAIADKIGCSLTTVHHILYPDQEALRQRRNAKDRAFVDRRRKKIQDIKMARGCADCGYNKYPEALDFDHRPGTEKLITIGGQLKSGTWQSVLDEIAKCDVVCANCHRHRTKLRRCPI
jgi:hypothetical protein